MKKTTAICTVLGLMTGDQAVKKYMNHHLPDGGKDILGGRVILKRLNNPGACLGFLKNHPKVLQVITGSMLVSLWSRIFKTSDHGHKLRETSLLLMIAGGTSNMLDRICQGYVDDYVRIPCRLKKISKTVFNLADVMIVAGALLSVISAVVEKD